MNKYDLKFPKGFDPKKQAKVGMFVAQLDDQLKRLVNNTKDLTIKQLEWQQKPGMNTIGMLIAHLALVEIWWIKIAPTGTRWEPEGKKIIHKVCGFKDDGLPLPPKGKHCQHIKGYSLEKYMKVTKKCRRIIKNELKNLNDKDLEKNFSLGTYKFSYEWTLYHVLEHFAAHFGQILMIKHMMRDAGVLKVKKRDGFL